MGLPGAFCELLSLLTARDLPRDKKKGRPYSACVHSAMLHATETGPMSKLDLNRLLRNNRAMIGWICRVNPFGQPLHGRPTFQAWPL